MTATEFGEYIFNIRDRGGLSRPAFSKKWGYHPNTIKSYEKEGRLPPVEYLAALSTETGESFIGLIKRLLSTGPLSKLDSYPDIEKLFDEMPMLRIDEADAAYGKVGEGDTHFMVDSDAMAPTIASGALLTCDHFYSFSQIKDGAIILLKIEGNSTVRRVQYAIDNQIILSCDNDKYQSTTLSKEAFQELNVLGIVRFTLNPV
ncbi:S24 family peptidase [Alteromonadaceae bacterium M269]|nr:S24 family peptidase [Alteromonadaceae bacterium M269]